VITIGSVADRSIFPDNGAYSASKFGIRAMHEVLRAETRGTGVRTTLISPSATDTPIWETVTLAPDNRFPPRDKMLGAGAVADAVVWAAMRPANVNVDELRITAS
jgi:NADP-dependent 3-hydroxy acid dehydrogenase YdfG